MLYGLKNTFAVAHSRPSFQELVRFIFTLILGNVGNKNKLLASAIAKNDIPMVRLLKQAIDLSFKDSINAELPLHLAAKEGHSEIIDLLVEGNTTALELKDSEGETPLLKAVRYGKEAEVKKLLVLRANPRATHLKGGFTAMHIAAEKDHVKAIQLLADRDLSLIEAKNAQGLSPLCIAASFGQVEALKELLRMDASLIVTLGEYTTTVLHLAAEKNQVGVIELLVNEEEQLLEYKNSQGLTPLHIAASFGQVKALKALLWQGASPRTKVGQSNTTALHLAAEKNQVKAIELLVKEDEQLLERKNSHGLTPLYIATSFGQVEALEELLSLGASPKDIDGGNARTALHVASEKGQVAALKLLAEKDKSLLEVRNKRGLTPFHVAASFGQVEALKELLSLGASPTDRVGEDAAAASENATTALHIASEEGRVGVIKLLAEKDKSLLEARNERGLTPFHVAAYFGQIKALKELLTLGASPIARVGEDAAIVSENATTALHIASEKGHVEVIKLLAEKDKALLEARNERGLNSLQVAAYFGQVKALKELLTLGASPIARVGENATTALHIASEKDHVEVIKLLVKNDKSLLEARNEQGLAPLHIAALYSKSEALKELLSLGADPGAKCRNGGLTALHIAAERGCEIIIKVLADGNMHLLEMPADDGATPIYLAVANRHYNAARLLIEYGAKYDDVEAPVMSSYHRNSFPRSNSNENLDFDQWVMHIESVAGIPLT